MVLEAAARRRGLAVLLIDTLLMYGGFFMLVPLITVHYVQNLGFLAASVGIVLAARQLTQQGLTLFGGALADRWGAKWLICAGLLIRTIGFAGLAWATTWLSLLLLCVLAAIGGALFEAPKSAAIATLAEPTQRARFFSMSGVAGGLGMTIGPFIGSLLLNQDFRWVCFASALCFAIAFVVTVLGLPTIAGAEERQPITRGLIATAHNGPFVAFTLLLCGYWFMWVQLSISLPLAAQQWAAPVITTPLGSLSIDGVAWVYALNAGMTVVLQYPLLRLAGLWLKPFAIVYVGVGLMALGLGAVFLTGSLPTLLLCVALFSLGAMLVQPSQQTVTAALADPQMLGAYFGASALSLAFGGSAGNYLGGWLYDLAQRSNFLALPWLIFCAVGLSVAVGLWALDRSLRGEGVRTWKRENVRT